MTDGFRRRQGGGVIIWAGILGDLGIGDGAGRMARVAAAGGAEVGPGPGRLQGCKRRKVGTREMPGSVSLLGV